VSLLNQQFWSRDSSNWPLEIDEIHYNDRLHPRNHGTGMFEQFITCFVDCAPVFVVEPRDKRLSDLLMQPKYGQCCYKIQIATNFLGWICFYSGLHHGTVPENIIYNNTLHQHPLKSWEFWCGDGAYNSCFGVLTSLYFGGKADFHKTRGFHELLILEPLSTAS
jgi:hypothetical protein